MWVQQLGIIIILYYAYGVCWYNVHIIVYIHVSKAKHESVTWQSDDTIHRDQQDTHSETWKLISKLNTSCHPQHKKTSIAYSQALRIHLIMIYSGEEDFKHKTRGSSTPPNRTEDTREDNLRHRSSVPSTPTFLLSTQSPRRGIPNLSLIAYCWPRYLCDFAGNIPCGRSRCMCNTS